MKHHLSIAIAFAGIGLACQALAAEADASKLTCKEVGAMAPAKSIAVAMWVNGYVHGKAGIRQSTVTRRTRTRKRSPPIARAIQPAPWRMRWRPWQRRNFGNEPQFEWSLSQDGDTPRRKHLMPAETAQAKNRWRPLEVRPPACPVAGDLISGCQTVLKLHSCVVGKGQWGRNVGGRAA